MPPSSMRLIAASGHRHDDGFSAYGKRAPGAPLGLASAVRVPGRSALDSTAATSASSRP